MKTLLTLIFLLSFFNCFSQTKVREEKGMINIEHYIFNDKSVGYILVKDSVSIKLRNFNDFEKAISDCEKCIQHVEFLKQHSSSYQKIRNNNRSYFIKLIRHYNKNKFNI